MIAHYFSTIGLPPWQLKIIKQFPDIYLEPNPVIVQWFRAGKRASLFDDPNYCNLRCGYEFDEGWAALAIEFSEAISSFVQKLRESGLQRDAWVRSHVFKQKLGELRWQGQNNLEPPFKQIVAGYIKSIEARSLNICERSGKFGELRNVDGWLQVLSEAEYQKVKKTRRGH